MPALHERSIEETLPLPPLVTPRSLVVRNAFTIFTKFFENGHRRVAAIYTWKRRQRRVADACQLRVIRPPPRFFPGWGRNWCCRAPCFITRKGGGGRGGEKKRGVYACYQRRARNALLGRVRDRMTNRSSHLFKDAAAAAAAAMDDDGRKRRERWMVVSDYFAFSK